MDRARGSPSRQNVRAQLLQSFSVQSSKYEDLVNLIQQSWNQREVQFKNLQRIIDNYRICLGTHSSDIEAIGNELNTKSDHTEALATCDRVLRRLERELQGHPSRKPTVQSQGKKYIRKSSIAHMGLCVRYLRQSLARLRDIVSLWSGSVSSLCGSSRSILREIVIAALEHDQKLYADRIQKVIDQRDRWKEKAQKAQNQTEIVMSEIPNTSTIKAKENQSKLSQMQAILDRHVRTIEAMKAENSQLRIQCSSVTRDNYAIENDRMRSELESKCVELEDVKAESQEMTMIFNERLKNAELLLRMKTEEIEKIQEEHAIQVRELQNTIVDLRAKVRECEKKLRKDQSEVLMTEKVKWLTDALRIKEHDCEEMQKELRHVKAELSYTQSNPLSLEIQELKRKNVELRSKHKDKIQTMTQVIKEKEAIITSLMDENRTLSGPIAQSKISNNEGFLNEMKHQTKELLDLCATKEASIKKLQDELASVKESMKKTQTRYAAVKDRMSFLKLIAKRNKELENEIADAKSQISVYEQKQIDLSARLQESIAQSNMTDCQVANKDGAIEKMEEIIQEKTKQIEKLEAQNQKLMTAAERQRQEEKNISSRVQREVESHEIEKSSLEARINSQLESIEKLKSKNGKMKEFIFHVQQMFNGIAPKDIPERVQQTQSTLAELSLLVHKIAYSLGVDSNDEIIPAIAKLKLHA